MAWICGGNSKKNAEDFQKLGELLKEYATKDKQQTQTYRVNNNNNNNKNKNKEEGNGKGSSKSNSKSSCTLLYATFVIFLEIRRGSVLVYTFVDPSNAQEEVRNRLIETKKEGYSAMPGIVDFRQVLKQKTSVKLALESQDAFDSTISSFIASLKFVHGLH